MADAATQTYANHVRRLPTGVTVVFLILLANILWSAYRLVTGFSVDAVFAFLVAICIPAIGFISRVQTLTVQNRVVRLEMRHRFRDLLQPDMFVRANALPISQIVALRFASDEELPGLVSEVLAGTVKEPNAIKQRIQQWQADHLRA